MARDRAPLARRNGDAPTVLIVIASLGLAALLGFATHRGSVCMVRGVAEVLGGGRAHVLRSIAKAGLWSFALITALAALEPRLAGKLANTPLSWLSLIGGFLFGIGAALNGSCAFSTLSRLADGRLSMLATLAGFAGGVLLHCIFAPAPHLTQLSSAQVVVTHKALWLALTAAAWGAFELRRLWQTRAPGLTLLALAESPQYRLSSAATLIGLGNGFLFLIHGGWQYTSALQQALNGASSPAAPLWLGLAVLAGMALSSWRRGSFRLDLRPRASWLRRLGGGVFMGLGAVWAQGGNDTLTLFALPSASPHAAPTLVAMLSGIALGLIAMRRLFGLGMRIVCDGDICRVSIETGGRQRLVGGASRLSNGMTS